MTIILYGGGQTHFRYRRLDLGSFYNGQDRELKIIA